jgi:hypothetical protein
MRNGRDAPVQSIEHSAPAGMLKCLLGGVHMMVPTFDWVALQETQRPFRPIAGVSRELASASAGGQSREAKSVDESETSSKQTSVRLVRRRPENAFF